MHKTVDKEKEERPRGWEALRAKLKERGLTGIELEEAQSSFYKGLGLLSGMFQNAGK